jgi:4-hydroxybutyrate dehydrogenase
MTSAPLFFPAYPPVRFGYGAAALLPGELAARGITRPLLITDRGLVACGVVAQVLDAFPKGAAPVVFYGIPPNPTIAGVDAALAVYKAEGCDGIVGLGGGSVLDSGKALRVVATHSGPVIDYLKDPSKIGRDVAPYIALPTTSGTGAEVTFGGGIHIAPGEHQLGIRSPFVKPDMAICDPGLTLTMPARLTAATGMDAFGHCVEGFLSRNENPPAEAIALDGIARVVAWIERATKDGSDREARSQMMMAGLQGGMSIYMGLGPVHALGHVFADSDLHHGALITASAPAVFRFYARVSEAEKDEALKGKLARLRAAMGLAPGADIAVAIEGLNARLGLSSSVRELGYPANDTGALADLALEAFFTAAAPRRPDRDEYVAIIEDALG